MLQEVQNFASGANAVVEQATRNLKFEANTTGESIDVPFESFGLVCFVNKNKNCQFLYS
jgi:hypothetical protein